MGAPEVDANHYIPQGGCWWDGSDCAGTLTKQNAGGGQRMPDKDNLGAVLQPTAGTLGNRGLRSHTELDGHGAYIPVAQPVPYDLFQITAPVNRQNRQPGDPCHTLARDNAAHAAVAFNFQGGSQQDQILTGNSVSPALAHASNSHGGHHQPKLFQQVAHAMTVRRLTPVECERLQGFPDDWTAIPWRKKPAEECPDGPRYKALGNSMACNCMAWIGERIAAYEQRGRVDPTPAGTAGIAPAGDLNHEGDRHG
jgi:DNA (cytosine-5)-methyltransferase 1